jgi:hypothetical protein
MGKNGIYTDICAFRPAPLCKYLGVGAISKTSYQVGHDFVGLSRTKPSDMETDVFLFFENNLRFGPRLLFVFRECTIISLHLFVRVALFCNLCFACMMFVLSSSPNYTTLNSIILSCSEKWPESALALVKTTKVAKKAEMFVSAVSTKRTHEHTHESKGSDPKTSISALMPVLSFSLKGIVGLLCV